MNIIRILPDTIINRIAAGEVVERPSSVIKELVENAIDAQSTQIDIIVHGGGSQHIIVRDNGHGMTKEMLPLAIKQHATSKLIDDNLFAIQNLGFRGEAIAAIASVSRFKISSRVVDATSGWQLSVMGGNVSDVKPASHIQGTTVEVKDLFYAVPARLKFLKTEKTELAHIIDIVLQLAIANPSIGFSLQTDKKTIFSFSASGVDNSEDERVHRLSHTIGKDFKDNMVRIHAQRDDIHIEGFIGLPTYNKANSLSQYFFVNGRCVRDKYLLGCVRAAFHDFIGHGRFPVVAAFLTVPPEMVDVNVHPAKAEVRFRFTSVIRSIIVGSMKAALQAAKYRVSTTPSDQALDSAQTELANNITYLTNFNQNREAHNRVAESSETQKQFSQFGHGFQQKNWLDKAPPASRNSASSGAFEKMNNTSPNILTDSLENEENKKQYPLGAACAQLHKTYIVSQAEDSIIIVDQHAAHERIVYENMKESLQVHNIESQALLIPEIIDLPEDQVERLLSYKSEFSKIGFIIEAMGKESIIIREIPNLFEKINIKELVLDLSQEISEWEQPFSIQDKLSEICGTIACHGSVRAGRSLNEEEMNRLLRQIETTPHSGQCNHGRPTYIKLKIKDIEKLFGRR